MAIKNYFLSYKNTRGPLPSHQMQVEYLLGVKIKISHERNFNPTMTRKILSCKKISRQLLPIQQFISSLIVFLCIKRNKNQTLQ